MPFVGVVGVGRRACVWIKRWRRSAGDLPRCWCGVVAFLFLPRENGDVRGVWVFEWWVVGGRPLVGLWRHIGCPGQSTVFGYYLGCEA